MDRKYFKKTIASVVILIFSLSIISPPLLAHAQSGFDSAGAQGLNLPPPGSIISRSPVFEPVIIRGITVHPENPLRFDFIIDRGEDQLQGAELQTEGLRMIKYFLASLTVPEDELWVNLSPYESGRIIPDALGVTEMGRDLLAQDYVLKQLTSSLIYPEDALGKDFWRRVYKRAQEEYGMTEIPVTTFNKVWIVPKNAVVYESWPSSFVSNSHLTVLLEEDYLALEKSFKDNNLGNEPSIKHESENLSTLSSRMIREIILPEIEKEVNEGKNFTHLRQIYNSMILAMWYKRRLKESLLNQIYSDKNKISGIDVEDKRIKEKIYQQYIKTFKEGVYNYIREDYDDVSKRIVPRKYFSGGAVRPQNFRIESKLHPDSEVPQESEISDLAILSMQGFEIGDQGNVDQAISASSDSEMKPDTLIDLFKEFKLLPSNVENFQLVSATMELLNPSGKHNVPDERLEDLIFPGYKGGNQRGEFLGRTKWDIDRQYLSKFIQREIERAIAQGLLSKSSESNVGERMQKLLSAYLAFEDSQGNNYFSKRVEIQGLKIATRLVNLIIYDDLNYNTEDSFKGVAQTANKIMRESLPGSLFEKSLKKFLETKSDDERISHLSQAMQMVLYANAPKIWLSSPDTQMNTDGAIARIHQLQRKALNQSLTLDMVEIFYRDILKSEKPIKMTYFVDDNGDLIYQLQLIQAYLKFNPNLSISLVVTKGRHAIDATYKDVMYELDQTVFDALRENQRFFVLSEDDSPEYSGVIISEGSEGLLQLLRDSNRIIVVGQTRVENLNGLRKPMYLTSYVDSKAHEVVSGLPQGSTYFVFVDGKDFYYKGVPAAYPLQDGSQDIQMIQYGSHVMPAAQVTLAETVLGLLDQSKEEIVEKVQSVVAANRLKSLSSDQLRKRLVSGYESKDIVYTSHFTQWSALKTDKKKQLVAGVFVLRRMNGEWSLLLGQRSKNANDSLGFFSAPVGKVDKLFSLEFGGAEDRLYLEGLGIMPQTDLDPLSENRESILAAGVRELHEEAGLPVKTGDLSARVDDFYGNHQGILVNFGVFVDDKKDFEGIVDNGELSNWQGIPLRVIVGSSDEDVGTAVEQYLQQFFPDAPLMHGLKTKGMRNLKKILLQALSKDDQAMFSAPMNSQNSADSSVGGINLDPQFLDLQIKRDAKGIPLPISDQPIYNIKIKGILPVIINVAPVSVPLLMGMLEDASSQEEHLSVF